MTSVNIPTSTPGCLSLTIPTLFLRSPRDGGGDSTVRVNLPASGSRPENGKGTPVLVQVPLYLSILFSLLFTLRVLMTPSPRYLTSRVRRFLWYNLLIFRFIRSI